MSAATEPVLLVPAERAPDLLVILGEEVRLLSEVEELGEELVVGTLAGVRALLDCLHRNGVQGAAVEDETLLPAFLRHHEGRRRP